VPNDDEIVKLLAAIDRRLTLLTISEERELRQALKSDVLQGRGQVEMFYGIDGVRGSGELAKLGGVGERSAQMFISELLSLGLVREVIGGTGRAVIVERDETAIVNWYLARQMWDE
jgi:hypothetical protein